MALSLAESQTLSEMADFLYDFLPGSGNRNFSFPMAAERAGVPEYWVLTSKRPSILRLLEGTLEHRRHRFCPLILAVVQLSVGYRSGKENPLTIAEIDGLNRLLLLLRFKIPELHDQTFRCRLAGSSGQAPTQHRAGPDSARVVELEQALTAISNLDATARGFEFERFLTATFDLFGLAPRGSFRLIGEQIDGSFRLDNETYLLEARWQAALSGNRELQAFAGTVHAKSAWTRGLFVSYGGFSVDGLEAFARGSATRIICANGEDLWLVLHAKLNLAEVLAMKTRRAAETGRAFISVRELYPNL